MYLNNSLQCIYINASSFYFCLNFIWKLRLEPQAAAWLNQLWTITSRLSPLSTCAEWGSGRKLNLRRGPGGFHSRSDLDTMTFRNPMGRIRNARLPHGCTSIIAIITWRLEFQVGYLSDSEIFIIRQKIDHIIHDKHMHVVHSLGNHTAIRLTLCCAAF